ncbi:TIGR03560 family F420-dependent LLM class oxidoreductase [Myxococcota bacterium]|nr:TIGR03560 family F420-dependent LLM class oxidoreductase [Myxococcota bacterium]
MQRTFGVHIGQQNLEASALRSLWRRLDDAGVDWISVWDHLYEAPPAGGTLPHFEALTTLGALAADTRNARIGILVMYPGYRNPALLAKAATTVDHLSGGRFVLGLGAGWHEPEATAYGYGLPPLGQRLDMLDESVQLIRSMLTQERTTFEGTHFRTQDASCLPPPVQERLPLWIGGTGEKRTLRMAARYADGWNAAYVGPEEYARLNGVLDSWCEREGRNPSEIERSVNLSFSLSADAAGAARALEELRTRWGDEAVPRLQAGSLLGTPDDAAERVTQYLDAGAHNVNIALRAPWDEEALNAYVTEVIPALQRGR